MTQALIRFLQAQDDARSGFATALRELRAGRKRSHWIWYIFPQLAGLGSSSMAQEYGLHGVEEATMYARDPILRARLIAVAEAVALWLSQHSASSLVDIAGSEIDALKIVSSMTLFQPIARALDDADPHPEYERLAALAGAILDAAGKRGLAPCASTTAALATSSIRRASSTTDP